MLKTPFGNIRMFLDKKEVEFNFSKIRNSKSFLKTETYLLKYEFKKEKVDKINKHFLKCILEIDFGCKSYIESGERLEAISFEINNEKLTIGTTSGLSMAEVDGNNNDFDVEYLKNGIEIAIFEKTRHQIFSFGVSFLENINVENEVQTWLAADYAINLKERVNKCQN
ncbi:hypothetical protein JMUB3935_1779 [Leptotrichia trevisanii]|uniref:Uncharacterized protein n=1 Tax=Leptotrichia trevisanii TaxID=109328 RepID=A0A510KM46_9FUSO|nr:hypothetical protein [Leptotrichia trevisanii]BBM52799.1 hypothetical protein JMUB3935_1779 [Leptotrichia trevisanii]